MTVNKETETTCKVGLEEEELEQLPKTPPNNNQNKNKTCT